MNDLVQHRWSGPSGIMIIDGRILALWSFELGIPSRVLVLVLQASRERLMRASLRLHRRVLMRVPYSTWCGARSGCRDGLR